MPIQYRVVAIKRFAYSLVELLVVLGIITLLAVIGVPNLFGSNERYALDNTADKLEQMLIDARTRSIAPTNNIAGGYSQIFQVTFSDFPQGSVSKGKVTAEGDIRTNLASLERGIASCGTGVAQGSVTKLKSLKFPRNVYVSSFFPTNQSPNDPEATVRFSIGKVGFQCGDTSAPIDSTELSNPYWSGLTATAPSSSARYLVIELSSKQIGEKRYIAIDRLNSEIVVSRTNPQAGFTALIDTFSPLWKDAPAATLTLVCRAETSEILLTYPRAVDRSKQEETLSNADPNRLVYYDIHWKQGTAGADQFQPLVSKYFSPLNQDVVGYSFTTGAVTTANQPTPLVFRVWAFDAFTNYSDYKEFSFARPADWDCGNNGGGGCVSKLPKRSVLFRPVITYNEGFDLDDNPCTSDTNNGTGDTGGQNEFGNQMLINPEI